MSMQCVLQKECGVRVRLHPRQSMLVTQPRGFQPAVEWFNQCCCRIGINTVGLKLGKSSLLKPFCYSATWRICDSFDVTVSQRAEATVVVQSPGFDAPQGISSQSDEEVTRYYIIRLLESSCAIFGAVIVTALAYDGISRDTTTAWTDTRRKRTFVCYLPQGRRNSSHAILLPPLPWKKPTIYRNPSTPPRPSPRPKSP